MDGITKAKIFNDPVFNAMLGKYPDEEIAAKFNCAYNFVKKVRQSKKIKAYREHKFPDGIEKFAGKMTDKNAAKLLNCEQYIIFRYRTEFEIPPYRFHDFSFKRQEIVEAYKTLGTLQKVGDKYGITRERVRQILNREGYCKRNTTRGRRKNG